MFPATIASVTTNKPTTNNGRRPTRHTNVNGAANQALSLSPLLLFPTQVTQPRLSLDTGRMAQDFINAGIANISLTHEGDRQINFFEPGLPVSRTLQRHHTAMAVLHLQELLAQTPKPAIILGMQYMNAGGVQLARYCRQQGMAVYADGFAGLTQYYQCDHGNIQQLASAFTANKADGVPLIYFGEPHLLHKMVVAQASVITRVEQAWKKGDLTIVAQQYSVFSDQQKSFCSSAQEIVGQLISEGECAVLATVPNQVNDQSLRYFVLAKSAIQQARNWPDALASIFVLLNYLPTPHGSAVFDVGSESISLLNKLCDLNAAPNFSSAALRSLLQGAIGDALGNLKELVNLWRERNTTHPILPLAVMGDTAFVNGGGQHLMLKFSEHIKQAFIAVIVLNNHQQKIENSLAAAPVLGHHNGQQIAQGTCVHRVANLIALKKALLTYVEKLEQAIDGQSVGNLLIDLDLTPCSQLKSMAQPIKALKADAARVDNLMQLIKAIQNAFDQPEVHGYACSFFELVHEITQIESTLASFHYHATLTDQEVFVSLAFQVATAIENSQQSNEGMNKRSARLVFMSSCFPVRLPDQIPQILGLPASPLVPIFVVADTPNHATSPFEMGLPHREFLTATVPIEKMFKSATQIEGDIHFVNTRQTAWVSELTQTLHDQQVKIVVVRM